MLNIISPPQERPRSLVQRYGPAILLVLLASGAVWLGGTPLRQTLPFFPFLLAVAISAYDGGPGAALLATIGGAVAGVGIAVHQHAFAQTRSDWLVVAGYFVTALAITGLTFSLTRRLRKVSQRCYTEEVAAAELRFTAAHQRIAMEGAQLAAKAAKSEAAKLQAALEVSDQRMTMAQDAAHFWLYDWDVTNDSLFVCGDLSSYAIGGNGPPRLATLLEAVHADDRERVETAVRQALASHEPLELETRVLRKSGAVRWATANGTAIYDKSGAAVRMVGVIRDVTEHKAAEEAIIRHEKLATAGRLAAAIAHEVNNPLAAVTNLLFIIKSDATLSDSGREYLSMALRELDRAAHITRQTLGFYRETAGPAAVDVAELLDDVLAFHGRNMPATVKVQRGYSRGLQVLGIAGELRQVFSNLVSNAIEVMGAGGTLCVFAESTTAPRPGVRVSVGDSGPGVRTEHIPLLFEPFFTTRKKAGTGLGLWVVKQIVQKHGGGVQVQTCTDAEGHGTSFSVFLPSTPAKMDPQPQRTSGGAIQCAV